MFNTGRKTGSTDFAALNQARLHFICAYVSSRYVCFQEGCIHFLSVYKLITLQCFPFFSLRVPP